MPVYVCAFIFPFSSLPFAALLPRGTPTMHIWERVREGLLASILLLVRSDLVVLFLSAFRVSRSLVLWLFNFSPSLWAVEHYLAGSGGDPATRRRDERYVLSFISRLSISGIVFRSFYFTFRFVSFCIFVFSPSLRDARVWVTIHGYSAPVSSCMCIAYPYT
ncbi:hypothetical protein BDN71DRAFT_1047223 [Pleurotus eryngii]|uniref:Uncharacterized protein n=1 Tax=Pleurotus eryngii TaxID=5323 RepID=A0A9P6A627_PLEER|nr:hypothetical protein BDN71DRAFT_1047223 [Pleurotus eryngii]